MVHDLSWAVLATVANDASLVEDKYDNRSKLGLLTLVKELEEDALLIKATETLPIVSLLLE